MTEKYKDASLPVDERVEDLLSRMTVKEKVGQMVQLLGPQAVNVREDTMEVSEDFKRHLTGSAVGCLSEVLRADPWTGMTLENGYTPRRGAEVVNMIQKYVIENTRLGIPMLFGMNCPHGKMAIGYTMFPSPISVASSWNKELCERINRVTATESRIGGTAITWSPVLDVARDPRWGRIEETYGEDPYMCGVMGAAAVRGLQGERLDDEFSIAACIKHFAAHGCPEGGRNRAQAHVGNRELREICLFPFKMAIDAGAVSVMTAYNEIDGIPCTCNKELLTDILRTEWGFRGFVTSDCCAVDFLFNTQNVAGSMMEAASKAFEAGVDSEITIGEDRSYLFEAVEKGLISMQAVNRAVTGILRVKFLLGLFENPYTNADKTEKLVNCTEHRNLAREAACQGMVLLKNTDNILPLNKDIRSIAVIGPNADEIYSQLGSYSGWQRRDNVVTVLDGIKNKLSPDTKILYARGCGIRNDSMDGFEEAVNCAKQSDVTVLVLGGSSSSLGLFADSQTGAMRVDDTNAETDCGEGFDRENLELAGVQMELAKMLLSLGKPVVIVLITGRPLCISHLDEWADAILMSWYPGEEGGNAVADILFGDYNPGGKMPISAPRTSSQLPVYYNFKRPGGIERYVEMDYSPLYGFGYGLSYTTFKYENIKVNPSRIHHMGYADVSVDVTNTGSLAGDEVVQLYIRDDVSSVTRPEKELKGFERIILNSGETKTVTFCITSEELKLLDQKMNPVVEPGTFTIMVGGNPKEVLASSLEVI